jgi:hypothetical protein
MIVWILKTSHRLYLNHPLCSHSTWQESNRIRGEFDWSESDGSWAMKRYTVNYIYQGIVNVTHFDLLLDFIRIRRGLENPPFPLRERPGPQIRRWITCSASLAT